MAPNDPGNGRQWGYTPTKTHRFSNANAAGTTPTSPSAARCYHPRMEGSFQTSDGHRSCYLDVGPRDGNVLLLVHGNSSSKRCFTRLISSLPELRIVVMDLPGHGDSDHASADVSAKTTASHMYTMSRCCALIGAFAAHLELDSITVAGHSFGGHVAIESLPELGARVDRVVIWGATPLTTAADLGSAFKSDPTFLPMFRPDASDSELAAVAATFIANEAERVGFAEDYRNTDPRFRRVLFETVYAGNLRNEVELLRNTDASLTWIHGTRDPILQTDYAERVATDLSASITRINAGHCPHIDECELLRDILLHAVQRQA